MAFLNRLEYLMRKNGIKSKAELAKVSGIPYTTIDGFYKKGTDNIKLSTLKRLTECLHCSLDFLTDEVRYSTLAAHFEGEDFTEEELEEIDNFVKYVKSKRNSTRCPHTRTLRMLSSTQEDGIYDEIRRVKTAGD